MKWWAQNKTGVQCFDIAEQGGVWQHCSAGWKLNVANFFKRTLKLQCALTMSRLALKYAQTLQGDFTPRRLNLMLVFQVNCPGCFVHALPTLLRLHADYSNRVNFLLLSTAFEDFELNTLENTQKLLAGGEVIGETRKALAHYGLSKFPDSIPCAVAFDRIEPVAGFLTGELLESMLQNHSDFAKRGEHERAAMKKSLRDYFLQNYERIGYTFAANLMQGTPTWIIFDESLEIQQQWFGHCSKEKLQQMLEKLLSK